MKHELSGFFAGKTNKEQRLQIADEIDVCNRMLSVDDISISCSKGCLSATMLGSTLSGIKMVPKTSERLHQELLKAIIKYRDELREAKIQIEDEHLAKK